MTRKWKIIGLTIIIMGSLALSQILPSRFRKSKDLKECVERASATFPFGPDKRVIEEFQIMYNSISKNKLEVTGKLDDRTYSAIQEIRDIYFSEESRQSASYK